jgi:hypothetical protein
MCITHVHGRHGNGQLDFCIGNLFPVRPLDLDAEVVRAHGRRSFETGVDAQALPAFGDGAKASDRITAKTQTRSGQGDDQSKSDSGQSHSVILRQLDDVA